LCAKKQNIKAFPWKSIKKGIRQSYCKKCQSIMSKAHYRRNKETYLIKAKKRNKEYKNKINRYIWEYLSFHPCIDCKEKDIVVLEFDHYGNKIDNISSMMRNKKNLENIKQEMDKCEVRCANCHKRKTAEQFKWGKLNYKLS